MDSDRDQVAIFWDFENCSVSSSLSGYSIVRRIREIASEFGSIKLFKAYTQLYEQVVSTRLIAQRSELQCSGVSITDCPHTGYKNVADQMIITDMLTFAMDNPTHASTTTIMILSGDRDFSYALSILRLRKYKVVVVAPHSFHQSVRELATRFFEWSGSVLMRLNDKEYSARARAATNASNDTLSSGPFASELQDPGVGGLPPSVAGLPTPRSPRVQPANSSSLQAVDSKTTAQAFNDVLRSPIVTRPTAGSQTVSTELKQALSLHGRSATTVYDIQNWKDMIVARREGADHACDAFSPAGSAASYQGGTEVVSSSPSFKFLPRAPLPSSPRPRSAEPTFPNSGQGPVSTSSAGATGVLPGRNYGSIDVDERHHPPSRSLPIDSDTVGLPLGSASPDGNCGSSGPDIGAGSKQGLSGGGLLSLSPTLCSSSGISSSGQTATVELPRASTTSPKSSPLLSPGTNIPSQLTSAASTLPSASAATRAAPVPSPVLSLPSTPAEIPQPNPPKPDQTGSAPPQPPPPPPPFKSIPQFFLPLVQHLEKLRLKGISNPPRSDVSIVLVKADKQTYQKAGCKRFKDFTAKAEKMGLIELGGREGDAWIRLHRELHGRIEVK
ncbi:hypothetical protein GYMLUDRAFT_221614 [Collybiopsis luxurians FD-317 M1]|uniref:NYN domain-containing protein n=1 Tax=Collybiopsis luxurians FD-317 M1 TaxID=944289 RepID=A0A0D0CMC8_9AGAR|nr:hypothetical protein GYMLUDRAFT_221614 [Collybiopsis luxurians FD-317 M1]